MNAAISERTIRTAQSWVLYDGECSFCTGVATRFAPMLRRHHFNLAPLQTPWVRKQLGLRIGEPLAEMKLLADDGQIYGGADALAQIARKIWWAWPLFAMAHLPGVKSLLRAMYRRVAANRHCLNGACLIQKPLARHHTIRTFFEMP